MASSGTATMTSSTSSRSACGSANARTPSTFERKRSRLAALRLATAWIGQPARLRATPSAVPTAPAPMIPMTGGSPGSACRWGCWWSLSWTSSPWRWKPGGAGSRSMPAASIAASVSACALAVAGSSPGGSRHALIGRRPRWSDGRGTLAPIECSEPVRKRALTAIDPFGARRPLGDDLPDHYRLAVLSDRIDLDRAPVTVKILLENALRHAGEGMVHAGRRRDADRVAAGPGRRGRDPVHALARDPPGPDRRARGRRPRGHARRDGGPRRRPGAGQPARARRTS